MIKLGCCIDSADIEPAYETGYDFIDLSGAELASMPRESVDKIAGTLKAYHLPCIGIHAAFPPEIALIGEKFSEASIEKYSDDLLAKAKKLDIRYLGIGSPYSRRLEDGYERSKADDQMIRVLEIMSGKEPGIRILLESLNREETNYINTLEEAARIVDRTGNTNTGLVWDLYHFIRCGESLDEISRDILSKVKYLHIADPAGRRYPSESSDENLFRLMQNAIRTTDCEYIAIEALSNDIRTDARKGCHFLKSKINQIVRG